MFSIFLLYFFKFVSPAVTLYTFPPFCFEFSPTFAIHKHTLRTTSQQMFHVVVCQTFSTLPTNSPSPSTYVLISLSLSPSLPLSLSISVSLSLLSILHFRFSFLQFCLLYVRFIASLFSLCPCCPTIITKIEPCIDATVVVCIECSVN